MRILCTVVCPDCRMQNHIPNSLIKPAGAVRCSWCRTLLKRDVRPWWRRLLCAS